MTLNTTGLNFRGEKSLGVVVGPVIGLVTPDSARVLVETNFDGALTVSARGRPRNVEASESERHEVRAKPVAVVGQRPTVVVLKKLRPEYQYTLHLDAPVFDLVHSGFVTPSADPQALLTDPLKIAVVSGNDVYHYSDAIPNVLRGHGQRLVVERRTHASDKSLWKDLYERVSRGQVHFVVHTGNNVDLVKRAFARAVQLELSPEAAAEEFRGEYRDVWTEPWTRHTLANVSNIMTSDETDIGEMRVVKAQRYDANREHYEAQRAYAEVANQVVREYQYALVGDLEADKAAAAADKNRRSSVQSSGSCLPSVGGLSGDNLDAAPSAAAASPRSAAPSAADADDPRDSGNLFNMVIRKLGASTALVMFDWRNVATFGADADPRLVGRIATAAQKHRLKRAMRKSFAPGSGVNSLVFVSPTNFFMEDTFMHARESHQRDLTDILMLLTDWKQAAPPNAREVLLLGNAMRSKGWHSLAADVTADIARPSPANTIFGFPVPAMARHVSATKPSSAAPAAAAKRAAPGSVASLFTTKLRALSKGMGFGRTAGDPHSLRGANGYGLVTLMEVHAQTEEPLGYEGQFPGNDRLVRKPVFWTETVTDGRTAASGRPKKDHERTQLAARRKLIKPTYHAVTAYPAATF